MSQYNSILERIFSAYPMYHKTGSSAYKEGLENIEELLQIIGNPEKKIKCVHVAGTNGKGSVSNLLSSYFQELGYKTGLYTSPHLTDFRERIRIDGEMISERAVIDFFNDKELKFQHLEPSFFEITTALAFNYFAAQNVDIAIVEVGLGGRLDATNVIQPLLSIITNISLEHTQLLGDTIAKIAKEKAGIIKNDVPVVVGEYHPESFPVFEDIANKNNAPLFLADANYSVECENGEISIKNNENQILYKNVKTELSGSYQLKNIATFVLAAKVLEFILNIQKDCISQAVENVIKNTGFRGRWQKISENPLIICDVGHNFAGISSSMSFFKHEAKKNDKKFHVVFGMVNDKDIDNIVPLLGKNFQYYVCKANIERALNSEILSAKMKENGLQCFTYQTVNEAIDAAKNNAESQDIIFITGSCFVVGEALDYFSK